MVPLEQRCEEFIESLVNLFNVFPSELRITIHDDDSILFNYRLNLLDSLLMRKTTGVERLFLIINLDRYFILRLFMNNFLIDILMNISCGFWGTELISFFGDHSFQALFVFFVRPLSRLRLNHFILFVIFRVGIIFECNIPRIIFTLVRIIKSLSTLW